MGLIFFPNFQWILYWTMGSTSWVIFRSKRKHLVHRPNLFSNSFGLLFGNTINPFFQLTVVLLDHKAHLYCFLGTWENKGPPFNGLFKVQIFLCGCSWIGWVQFLGEGIFLFEVNSVMGVFCF